MSLRAPSLSSFLPLSLSLTALITHLYLVLLVSLANLSRRSQVLNDSAQNLTACGDVQCKEVNHMTPFNNLQ